jgi:tRNA A-37 threonylcarbamoyl transferase component Bud32
VSEDDSLAKAHARVGAVLKDKWRLDSLIGVGGMAAVYAATHRNKNRVAVKMLHAQFSGEETVRTRFLREGYLANTVEHAGAVKVLDDDVSEEGAAFLVMELLDGETIEARWARKKQRLDPGEVLAIGDKLLDVLASAHDKGIVHRDIKPENLFLTREGTLKVLDFGIARIFEGAREQKGTRQGYIMGTPAFMSPEQALAHWDQVDGRTDLWAVGATMFTLLTGRHVHEAQTGNEQLIRSATTPAVSIASVDAGLPPPIVELIDVALAFDKVQRWADARAMRQALRKAYTAFRPRTPGSAENARTATTAVETAATLIGGTQGAQPLAVRFSKPDAEEASDRRPVAAPADPAAVEAQLAARMAERDARAAELAAAMPAVTELNQRLAAARRRVADIQQRILDAKNEHAALDVQFRRQTLSKTEGVGEARRNLNDAMVAFAQVAFADGKTFGAEFEDARDGLLKLAKTTAARAHDVEVYEMAMKAYDPEGLRRGVFAVGLALGVVVLLFFVPFIVRATMDSSQPARPPPMVETAPPQ